MWKNYKGMQMKYYKLLGLGLILVFELIVLGCKSMPWVGNETPAIPEVKNVRVINQGDDGKWKTCFVKYLGDGNVAFGIYNNNSRRNSKVFLTDKDGNTRKIYPGVENDGTSSSAETYGYPRTWHNGELYFPLEKGVGRIIAINKQGQVRETGVIQPYDFSNVELDGMTVAQNMNQENHLWNIVTGERTDIVFPNLRDICMGLERDGDKWVAGCGYGGIQWSTGEYVQEDCNDLIKYNKEIVALLRNGWVIKVGNGKKGADIADLGVKPMRAIAPTEGKLKGLLIIATSRPDRLYIWNGKEMKLSLDLNDPQTDGLTQGEQFDTSIDYDGVSTVYFGRSCPGIGTEMLGVDY